MSPCLEINVEVPAHQRHEADAEERRHDSAWETKESAEGDAQREHRYQHSRIAEEPHGGDEEFCG